MHNITKEHGLVSLQQVQSHAKSHIGQETQLVQDDVQLLHCLMDSLTVEGKSKILLQRSDWCIKDDDGFVHKLGIMLLKVIMHESRVDTNATVLSVCKDLAKLDERMVLFASNITKFNTCVKGQILALAV